MHCKSMKVFMKLISFFFFTALWGHYVFVLALSCIPLQLIMSCSGWFGNLGPFRGLFIWGRRSFGSSTFLEKLKYVSHSSLYVHIVYCRNRGPKVNNYHIIQIGQSSLIVRCVRFCCVIQCNNSCCQQFRLFLFSNKTPGNKHASNMPNLLIWLIFSSTAQMMQPRKWSVVKLFQLPSRLIKCASFSW